MDRVEQMVGVIPPISRAWLASIAVASVVTSNGIVERVKLVFIPNKISAEPWRLVSLFCYFGPLLFSLVQYLLQISRSVSALEGAYVFDAEMLPKYLTRDLDLELGLRLKTAVELNRTIDFAYFATQIAASIVVASAAIYTVFNFSGTSLIFLGPILERSLLYLWCKISPEDMLLVLGLPVRAKYVVWLTLLLHGILSEDFVVVTGAFRLNFLHGLWTLLTCEFVAEMVVVFTVAHFWWFVRYFLAGDLYHELKTESRRAWVEAYKKNSRSRSQDMPGFALRRSVLTLVSPPWYWVICRQLQAQQAIRQAAATEAIQNAQTSEGVPDDANPENVDSTGAAGGSSETVDHAETTEIAGTTESAEPTEIAEITEITEPTEIADIGTTSETTGSTRYPESLTGQARDAQL